MAYKRTVHCSHCGIAGHNRSGCPDFRDRIEQIRNSDPYDYRVQRYDAKKARKAASAQNRRCTYCGEQGHNRAGCPKLKEAMEKYRAINVRYRRNVLDALIENGLGPGAMFKTQLWNNNEYVDRPVMVTDIRWELVNHHNKTEAIVVAVPVEQLGADRARWGRAYRLPHSITGNLYAADFEIAVRTSERLIMNAVPASFLDGTLSLKQVFRNKDLDFYTMKDRWGAFDNEFNPSEFSSELG